jgi:hypothetical protein
MRQEPIVEGSLGHAETNLWLLITSRRSWQRLAPRREWVFPNKCKTALNSIQPGDFGTIYLTAGAKKDCALGGVVMFIGRPYRTEEDNAYSKFFPWRVPLEIQIQTEAPFRPLISKLSFLKSGPAWGSGLQGQPIKRVSLPDFRLFLGSFGAAAELARTENSS